MSPIGLSQGLAPHLAAREPFLRSFRLCFARSDLGSASSLPVSPAARMPSVCVLRGTFIEEKEKTPEQQLLEYSEGERSSRAAMNEEEDRESKAAGGEGLRLLSLPEGSPTCHFSPE